MASRDSVAEENASDDEEELVLPLLQLDIPSSATKLALEFSMRSSLFLTIPGTMSTPLNSFSSIEGNLFDYFVASICPNCSLSSSQNPYLTLLTPMSFMFPPLKSALLAVSANQLQLLNDKRFQGEALKHKSMAIQGIQKALDDDQISLGVIATILLLCFYDVSFFQLLKAALTDLSEISDGCNGSWVTHLRGGLNLLATLSASEYSSDNNQLFRFLHMYFVAHEIMSRTASEDELVVETSEWLEGDNLEEIDPLMGCSRNLMTLIRHTTTLASKVSGLLRIRDLTTLEIQSFSTNRDNIERSLYSLKQTSPPSDINPSNTSRIAETKRLSAVLYLRERLAMIPSPQTLSSSMNAPITYKADLINTIISLISSLPDSSTLLWPLFVLGNMDLNEDNRRFVLERLTSIQRVRNLGSVRKAKLLVEDAWKKSDLKPTTDRLWDGRFGGRRRNRMISLA